MPTVDVRSAGTYRPYTRMPAVPVRQKRDRPAGQKRESHRAFRRRRKLWPSLCDDVLAGNIATVHLNLESAMFNVLRRLEDGSELADALAQTAVASPDSLISDSFSDLARIARSVRQFDFDRALMKRFPAAPGLFRSAGDLADLYPTYFRLPYDARQNPVWPRPDARLRTALRGAEPTASGYRRALQLHFAASYRASLPGEARTLSVQLDSIRSRAFQLPPAVAGQANDVCDALAGVVDKFGELDPAGRDVQIIRSTIAVDLPETLALLEALPGTARSAAVSSNGRTPIDVARSELAIMLDAIRRIRDRLLSDDADRLLSHERFVNDKYGSRSALTVPD